MCADTSSGRQENFTHDVFLSHSSKDKATVRPIAERLKKDGLRVWFDEWEIKPGDNIPAKIEEGLDHSRVLVLCMSAHAFGSDWAQLEAGTFRFRDSLNKERRFVPIRLDETPIKGTLAQFLYIDWRVEEGFEQAYVKLCESCGASAEQGRSPKFVTDSGQSAASRLFYRDWVEAEFEKLDREKITPWAFLATQRGISIEAPNGQTWRYSGVKFDGAPRQAFWNGFINPFVQDIAWRMFDRVRAFCVERALPVVPAMTEVAELLKSGLAKSLKRMVEIDRGLRGEGYPKTVQPVDVRKLQAELVRIIDNRLSAEMEVDPNHGPTGMRKPNNPPTQTSMSQPQRPSPKSKKTALYALMALGAFICALATMALLLWKADTLAALGLVGSFYYIVLLPLALFVAAFLFGAMRSYAHYAGKQMNGTLELGGPIVGAALVVIGGFALGTPLAGSFPLTVFVHGDGGKLDMVVRDTGFVVLDLDGDRRREAIGDKGQAFFPSIPAQFRSRPLPVSVDAQGFEPVGSGQYSLEGNSIYLQVRRLSQSIRGYVQDDVGRKIQNAVVSTMGIVVNTDATGYFELGIPADRLRPEMSVQVEAAGYLIWRGTVVPGANDATVVLRSQPKIL